MFEKGDILQGEKNKRNQAFHYIVYLDGSDNIPVGVVLTHSKDYVCNKVMKPEHFVDPEEWFDESKATCLIAHKFQKLEEWGPYNKKGRLTQQGIQFVENLVSSLESQLYSEYIIQTSNGNKCLLHRS